MIWVQGTDQIPFAFLLLAAALRSMDPSLEEAATTAEVAEALDRAVRLGDPVEMGEQYSEQGADELVFLDITMPEMNGLDALRAIKASDKDARVLMVSAMGQQKMIVEALEAGRCPVRHGPHIRQRHHTRP